MPGSSAPPTPEAYAAQGAVSTVPGGPGRPAGTRDDWWLQTAFHAMVAGLSGAILAVGAYGDQCLGASKRPRRSREGCDAILRALGPRRFGVMGTVRVASSTCWGEAIGKRPEMSWADHLTTLVAESSQKP